MISMIASVGRNLEIGKDGDLAFRGKGELGYFKKITMGKKVLMGLNTFRSLPKRLEGREYFVACRDDVELPDWVTQVRDLKAFLMEWQQKTEEIFVIGGGMIYKFALPFADRLYLTEIDAECVGADTFFPSFDKAQYKKEKAGEGAYDNGLKFTRFVYSKK